MSFASRASHSSNTKAVTMLLTFNDGRTYEYIISTNSIISQISCYQTVVMRRLHCALHCAVRLNTYTSIVSANGIISLKYATNLLFQVVCSHNTVSSAAELQLREDSANDNYQLSIVQLQFDCKMYRLNFFYHKIYRNIQRHCFRFPTKGFGYGAYRCGSTYLLHGRSNIFRRIIFIDRFSKLSLFGSRYLKQFLRLTLFYW